VVEHVRYRQVTDELEGQHDADQDEALFDRTVLFAGFDVVDYAFGEDGQEHRDGGCDGCCDKDHYECLLECLDYAFHEAQPHVAVRVLLDLLEQRVELVGGVLPLGHLGHSGLVNKYFVSIGYDGYNPSKE
jgi:hypothetical protein